MNHKTHILIAAFIGVSFVASAQSNTSKCFEDCMTRRSSVDSKMLMQSIRDVLAQLNGCSFPAKPLKDLDANPSTIAQYKGKLVFIHFWFEGCAPCVAEIPSINRLTEEYKKKDVAFIAISRDKAEDIKQFLQKKSFSAIQYVMTEDASISDFCVVGGYPMNMLLDRNGKVIEVWSGGMPTEASQQEFYNKVKSLINAHL